MSAGRVPEGIFNVYATLAELKARAGIADADGESSLWLALYGAARAIDRFCNRHFYVLNATRTFDLHNPRSFAVPDLVSVTALREDADGDRVFETLRDPSDYMLFSARNSPQSPRGRPYGEVVADPNGARPRFALGHRAMQLEGEWSFRKDIADTGADLDQGGPLSALATTVTVTDGTLILRGQTLLVDHEQMFVRDLIGNDVTVARAVNGTSAVSHIDGTDVSMFRYPKAVVEASILMAGRLWKQRDSPFGPTAGAHGFGVLDPLPGMDPDLHKILSPLQRLPLVAAV